MKFDFYADPGHGWIRVSRQLIDKLDIADKISGYSYQRRDSVYLEEDCDFSVFVDAMKKAGKTVETKYHHTNKTSKIRNYLSYRYGGIYQ